MVVRAEGMYLLERARRAHHRRGIGTVLLRRRPRPEGDRGGRRSPAGRARLHRAVPARASRVVRVRAAARRADAGRPRPHFLRQQRLRGRRHGDEGGARLSPGARPGRAHDVRVAGARLSRRQFRRARAVGSGEQPPPVRIDAARRRPHAPHAGRGQPLHPGRGCARGRARRGPAALRRSLRRREHRRLRRRTDRRIDRLPGAAEGLSQAPARDLRPARHPAGVRRGHHRLRPHRPDVRGPELRRHARHAHAGQGPHQRRAADGRRGDQQSASTTRSSAPRRSTRSSSSTATPTRAIRPPVPRGSRRSTSTATKRCSSAVGRWRRISSTRSSRCATCRSSPTSAATA